MKIVILKHAYHPDLQGMESPKVYGEYFDTLEDAQEWILDQDSSVYVLEHGESGRPTYVVLNDMDADYIEFGRNSDMSNYDWTEEDDFRCRACGECSACIKLMIEQDRQYALDTALFKS